MFIGTKITTIYPLVITSIGHLGEGLTGTALHSYQKMKYNKEFFEVTGWINKDLPSWVSNLDNFDSVCTDVRNKLGLVKVN